MLGRARAPQLGHFGSSPTARKVCALDLDACIAGIPNGVRTRNGALQMVNRAVNFANIFQTGALKLPVHVRGVNARRFFVGPLFQNRETIVRHGLPIQMKPVSIKSPRQSWVRIKPTRIRHIGETDAQLGERRISVPETLVAPEIGQTRIDAHASARREKQKFSVGNGARGGFDGGQIQHKFS